MCSDTSERECTSTREREETRRDASRWERLKEKEISRRRRQRGGKKRRNDTSWRGVEGSDKPRTVRLTDFMTMAATGRI